MKPPVAQAGLDERNIRQRQWNAVVGSAVNEVEEALLKPYPGFHHTTFFGAMDINPSHLAIWCFFKTDDDLATAKDEGLTTRVQTAMREALRRHGYPGFLTPTFFVSFATDEDVQKSCGGNYWRYLK